MSSNSPFPDNLAYEAFEPLATDVVFASSDQATMNNQQMIATWALADNE